MRIPPKNAVVIAAAIFLPAAVVVALDKPLFCGAIARFFGPEPYKLTLQFLIITGLGGLLFAFLSARKEEDARREARIARLQSLDEKLAIAHRQMKASKRRLRSKTDRAKAPELTIPKADFEACMEDVLSAQLAVEEVQDLVGSRRELISARDLVLLDQALQYAARYLHDVYEDFEQGNVKREGDGYSLTDTSCPNIWGFLSKPPQPDDVEKHLLVLKDRESKYDAIVIALAALDKYRVAPDKEKKRFGKVAIECLRLVSSELRRLIDAEASW